MTAMYEYLSEFAARPGSITFAGAMILAAFILVQIARSLCNKPNLLQERAPTWLPVATVLLFTCLIGIDHLRANGLG
jgi:hypothetical protein